MTRRILWIGIGCLAAVVSVAGCPGGSGTSEDPDEVELRSYTVPEGFDREQWSGVLQNTFAAGETSIGSVSYGPGNTLVVTAPRSVHDGIERLIDGWIAQGGFAQPAPATIAVDYWVLLGRPVDDDGVKIASERLKRLEILSPVLDQIASFQGPTEFHLLEQLRLTSVDTGQRSEMQGRQVRVQQRVMNDGSGGRLADVGISMSAPGAGVVDNLETRIRLEPGKFIVLGQTDYNARAGDVPEAFGPADDRVVLYLVGSRCPFSRGSTRANSLLARGVRATRVVTR